ncbi:ATP-binding protein [Achromobacter sp. PD1]|uniref:PAS domain-containing hybrid sensor histidine kinase/response regulator n=1 Tax=Achromobacter sp. PD1 TaxID=3399125 RepID=UPI003AF8EFF6
MLTLSVFLNMALVAALVVMLVWIALRILGARSPRRELAELASLADTLPAGIFIRDLDLNLVTRNDALKEYAAICRREGWNRPLHVPQDSLSAPASGSDLPANLNEIIRDYRQVLASGETLVREHPFQHDSTCGVAAWAAPLRGEDGTLIGLIGGSARFRGFPDMLREVSETRLNMERANLMKSTYLAFISHELRTPLNAIIGMLELILSRDGLSGAVRERLAMSRQSAQSLLSLIGGLIDISKLETGHLQLRRQNVDLRALAADTLAPFRAAAQAKGLQLTLDIGGDLAERHFSDPIRLKQLLDNLLSNSVRFTDHGRIDVSLSATRATEEVQWITLCVADTGPGIAEEVQARLAVPHFEPMVREQGAGIGLGLSICSELTRLMGGSMEISSTAGQGARVTVRLPLALPPSESATVAAATAPTAADAGGLRLLVIDDHEANRLLLKHQLRMLKHSAQFAQNGAAGLALAERLEFDLIICDCVMPVMDGTAFTAALRAGGGMNAATPVLGYTASELELDLASGARASMNAVLIKPVDLQTLQSFILAHAKRPPGGTPKIH